MAFDPEKHHRRSVRLQGYDYAASGAYFVTLCVQNRRCVFGHIEDGLMRLNAYGRLVEEEWLCNEKVRSEVLLDQFVVMPNHLHALVFLSGVQNQILESDSHLARRPRSLSSMIAMFKASSTRRINERRLHFRPQSAKVLVWQRNFYEHVVRSEKSCDAIRRYIAENPLNWLQDSENPEPKSTL